MSFSLLVFGCFFFFLFAELKLSRLILSIYLYYFVSSLYCASRRKFYFHEISLRQKWSELLWSCYFPSACNVHRAEKLCFYHRQFPQTVDCFRQCPCSRVVVSKVIFKSGQIKQFFIPYMDNLGPHGRTKLKDGHEIWKQAGYTTDRQHKGKIGL